MLDRAYDWSPHVGRYDLLPNVWDRLKAENPVVQDVAVDSSPQSLNLEQKTLYNAVVDHYTLQWTCSSTAQLLLNVDGVAGSGKTFTLPKTCARIQELAARYGMPNPVFRAAPTGIAAFDIVGRTLHSLLRLPVKGRMSDLLPSTLQSLQALFQHCCFLVID